MQMSKTKIIFFAYNLEVGGIETALVTLLKKLDKTKYDITLVLEEKKGVLLDELPSQIHLQEYRVSNSKNILLRKIINFTKRIRWSLKNKNKYRFSCCYATQSIPGSVLARIASSNHSFYVHSSYQYVYPIKEEYCQFFNERGISKFKHIFFVSNEARIYFETLYPTLVGRAKTLGNLVNPSMILKKSIVPIQMKKNDNDILFVFVGRFDEASKRISRLILLIESLKKKDYPVKCWLVGTGPDEKEIKHQIFEKSLEDTILLCGLQLNPYPYMKQADYLILTSEYEGFPMIYLEGVILQKKIITTMDVSDDLISIPNRFGYIISKKVEQMVPQVEQIITSDSLNYESCDMNVINERKLNKLNKIIDGEII